MRRTPSASWAPCAAGSTCIGAALRHATRCLLAEPAGLRAIVLITDGAPSDIDVFDARYLTEDARAAVLAARLGVQCHGLVVDPGLTPTYAASSAGVTTAWPRPAAQLPRQLGELYDRLAAR